VELFALANANGVAARIMTYGATIVSLKTPDRSGRPANIVLGFNTLGEYLSASGHLGAVVGRYANRIALGRFALDGTTFQLTTNSGPNHIHGGPGGFDKVVWAAEQVSDASLTLAYTSADGEEGYPGTLRVQVRYTLNEQNELRIEYAATTNAPTIVNLTQHSYFNLAGVGDVLDHELTVAADHYTPVGAAMIPTGELAPVAGTPFDFRAPRRIGARTPEKGYDLNFVINRATEGLVHAARVVEPTTGRMLDVTTTEPGVQFYSGRRTGLCLETQHYPDSPNHPEFPSTILRPGEEYRSTTVFRFGVAK
jgi:aldose 1-epimerase